MNRKKSSDWMRPQMPCPVFALTCELIHSRKRGLNITPLILLQVLSDIFPWICWLALCKVRILPTLTFWWMARAASYPAHLQCSEADNIKRSNEGTRLRIYKHLHGCSSAHRHGWPFLQWGQCTVDWNWTRIEGTVAGQIKLSQRISLKAPLKV